MMAASVPKHGRERNRGFYLRYAKAESYGALSQVTLGPLGPGLNVIHGVNEAGKTTLASLIGGVMFGWEDGRSTQNTYKPTNAERSGVLLFAPDDEEPDGDGPQDEKGGRHVAHGGADGGRARLTRLKNADGVQGDGWLLEDIDRDTYREIFSLNSDQLRSMGDAGQVTSKLLTASAGTATPPSQVRGELDDRIAEYMSRSNRYPHSIARLTEQRDNLATHIEAARKQSDDLREDEAKVASMGEERLSTQRRVNRLNVRIERLNQSIATIDQLKDRDRYLRDCLADEQGGDAGVDAREDFSDVPERLRNIEPSQDAALREQIDAMEAEQADAAQKESEARGAYESALEEYEAGLTASGEAPSDNEEAPSPTGPTFSRAVLLAVVAFAFAALGVVATLAGGTGTIFMSAALFAGAVIFAILAVAYAIRGFASESKGIALNKNVKNAKWVMEKEKVRYDLAKQKREETEAAVEVRLAGMGLSKAGSDLATARVLLERAAAARAQKELDDNRGSRASKLRAELKSNKVRLAEEISACGIKPEKGVDAVRCAVDEAVSERDDLLVRLEEINLLAGQAKQRLEAARGAHDLDELRMQHQQVLTRLEESKRDLAKLLLARRMLDEAMDEWQGASQPEVYREAGRLLSRMTDGRWRSVVTDDTGKLWVADALETRRDPQLLSMGTCQQLYLAMRIALLNTAEFVGRNVPVICDDILVNFDEKRQKAAALAIAQLARKRQVILFTCHKDVVSTLQWADESCTVIEL